jgi:hypothetical protein
MGSLRPASRTVCSNRVPTAGGPGVRHASTTAGAQRASPPGSAKTANTSPAARWMTMLSLTVSAVGRTAATPRAVLCPGGTLGRRWVPATHPAVAPAT